VFSQSGTAEGAFHVSQYIDSYTFGPGVFEISLDLDRALDVTHTMSFLTTWNEFAYADGSYFAGEDYHDFIQQDLGVGTHFVDYVTARDPAPEPGMWGPTYRIWYSRVQTSFQVAADDQGPVNWTLTVSTVPEPGAWALMITGFGMLGVVLRRRRARMAF
jgi:hypothetical protein